MFKDPVTKLVDRTNITKATMPGGVELTFAAAVIVHAGKQEIAARGSPELIPELIKQKVQALDFTLGYGGYKSNAIQAHFTALMPYSFFRYVIFLQSDHSMFGMMEARALAALLQDPKSGLTYSSFTEAINRGNDADRARLAQLPSFVPVSESVSDKSQKREVLEQMEKSGREWLPVAGNIGGGLGIVDRSRLTASIVLDVTNQLTASQSQNAGSSSQN